MQKSGEIICLENELILLTSIFDLDEVTSKNNDLQYSENITVPINLFLKEGKIDSLVEVIRDFNGWSWDIDISKINNIYSNFLYQTLILYNRKREYIKQ